jgi:hypothetical protein
MLILISVNGTNLTLWNKMPNKKFTSLQYKRIRREDIMDFVNELYDIQAEFIELAVEKSKMKEANEVIKYIMEKK